MAIIMNLHGFSMVVLKKLIFLNDSDIKIIPKNQVKDNSKKSNVCSYEKDTTFAFGKK